MNAETTQNTSNAGAPDAPRKKIRRRILVTDRALQARIVNAVSWPSVVGLVLTAIILSSLCKNLIDEAQAYGIQLSSVVPILLTVILFLFASTAFLAFNALKISHRVAGPMVAFRNAFKNIEDGDLKARVRLREGDYLEPLAADFNDFLDNLMRTRSMAASDATPQSAGSESPSEDRQPAMSGATAAMDPAED